MRVRPVPLVPGGSAANRTRREALGLRAKTSIRHVASLSPPARGGSGSPPVPGEMIHPAFVIQAKNGFLQDQGWSAMSEFRNGMLEDNRMAFNHSQQL